MSEPIDDDAAWGVAEQRLDSWKAISAYLKRDVTTVQRWEKREGMPVHRHIHDKLGSVYAYRSELDAWMRGRAPAAVQPEVGTNNQSATRTPPGRSRVVSGVTAVVVVLLMVAAVWWAGRQRRASSADPLEGAQFQMVTDFDGTEQAAAISRDGRLVAFVSDRDGAMDVWIAQFGTGQFYNLTRGRVRQLVNPSVRTLGFTPDGALVTFWARGVEGAANDDIGIWAIPTLGGQPRPYLEGVAEFDWSSDGSKLVYHTPGPGDPTFVTHSTSLAPGPPIFSAAAGLHAHFPTWSQNAAFIYFVQGSVPDAMDVWRMRPDGTNPERITHHNAIVSHPILLDDSTLVYLAGMRDGAGPRLHVMDIGDRLPRPQGTDLDRFTSLAASADRRRIVATRANPKGTLWRLRVGAASTATPAMSLVSVPTGRGLSPRYAPGFLVYIAPKATGDAVWKLVDGAATELWSAPGARIFGGPEISRDGRRVAFSVEQGGKSLLYVVNADGTNARILTDALRLQGAPSWAPDGQAIASGAILNGTSHLFRIPLEGPPQSLIEDVAIDPAWSPAGDFVVYSAADIGTEFAVKAVTSAGQPHPVPALTLTRGARRLRFYQGRRVLIAMRGDIRHKDLWLIDLDTGTSRQLTQLPADFNIRDFDVSVDGQEIVVERVQEHSDIVLIDLTRRP